MTKLRWPACVISSLVTLSTQGYEVPTHQELSRVAVQDSVHSTDPAVLLCLGPRPSLDDNVLPVEIEGRAVNYATK